MRESSVGAVRSDFMILVRVDVQQDVKLGSVVSKRLQYCSIAEVVANLEGWLCWGIEWRNRMLSSSEADSAEVDKPKDCLANIYVAVVIMASK